MLMRFDPFAELDRLTQSLWNMPRPRAWSMPVDAYRTDDRFWLLIDLPGVDPDTIDVQVEDSTLTVRVDRSWTLPEGAELVISERPHGTFVRQFFLGEGLDTDKIEAEYEHGVLTISIPVAEEAKPRKITVGSSEKVLTA
jgi:HSP20 family protein